MTNEVKNQNLVEPSAEAIVPEIHPEVAANGIEPIHEQEDQQNALIELRNMGVNAEHAGHNTPVSTNPSMVSLPTQETNLQNHIGLSNQEGSNDETSKWKARMQQRKLEKEDLKNAA